MARSRERRRKGRDIVGGRDKRGRIDVAHAAENKGSGFGRPQVHRYGTKGGVQIEGIDCTGGLFCSRPREFGVQSSECVFDGHCGLPVSDTDIRNVLD
jgi:hypothetical protein